MHVLTRMKKRVFQFIVPPLFLASRALYSLCRQTHSSEQYISSPEEPSEIHYLDPVDMAQRINAALQRSPWQPDFIFNMYLDMYKTSVEPWRQFAAICRIPWGGIRFVPSDPPPREGYYTLSSLRGMCFLDESTCQSYRSSISDKHFQYLPDVTNAELPEKPCPMAEEILRRAAGRKIVFLGGSVGGHKNVARWCELIALADPKRWFFVQVGEIHASTFSVEDTASFERFATVPPENLFLYTRYLLDERDFNAIIRVVDILFAVYRNFRISSNMLTKAAFFKKPIIVSQGVLMGRLVEQFGIGIAVPEQDCAVMLAALEKLATCPPPETCYANYMTRFNEGELASRLDAFVVCCLEGRHRA
jgi:hypothetical protein